MSNIAQLAMQNVRCFSGTQSVDMGKVTLLVGENGTGKSTFLGCCSAFARLASFGKLEDPGPNTRNCFDEEPFRMGRYRTIARHGADSFSVDGALHEHCHTAVGFSFSSDRNGQPSETRLRVELPNREDVGSRLSVTRDPESPKAWRFAGKRFAVDIPQQAFSYRQLSTWVSMAIRHGYMPFAGDPSLYRRASAGSSNEHEAAFVNLINFLQTMPVPRESIPIYAPPAGAVRRQREYQSNPIPDWDDGLRKYFAGAGRELGLFSEIDIGGGNDSHYEIRVRQSKGWYNIADTGFGVPNILPLLHAMYRQPEGTTFLLQQPEVNIHPSAQARLAEMMATSPYRFVIETHSDHLIDQFRICVMEAALAPRELRISYFERVPEREASVIHNMTVDDAGNLDGAPASYRRFFLGQTDRLLGIGGH